MVLVLLAATLASELPAQPRASAVRIDPSLAVAHDRLGFVLGRHARAHYQLGLALERTGAQAEAKRTSLKPSAWRRT